MEDRWETLIHTLDVGQGDSSLIQVRCMRVSAIETDAAYAGDDDKGTDPMVPPDYKEDEWETEEINDPFKKNRKRNTYCFFCGERWDVAWDHNILIDGGEEGNEEKILKCINDNVKSNLNSIIITHADTDHYGGINMLLLKNNLWNICDTIAFQTANWLIGEIFNGAGELREGIENEEIAARVTDMVCKVIDRVLDFEDEGKKNLFKENMIDAFRNIIWEIYQEPRIYADKMKEYVQDWEKQGNVVNGYLYGFFRKGDSEGIITGMCWEGETIEDVDKLSKSLTIYISVLAHAQLFSGKIGRKKEEIYKGSRIAEDILVKSDEGCRQLYNVSRTIEMLAPKQIGMDFLSDIQERPNSDRMPVKMILAAVDGYAHPNMHAQIGGDSNERNCRSIAVLFQMGGFLFYSGGDLPGAGETMIAQNFCAGQYRIRVPEGVAGYRGFKVGHHGSTTATAEFFLQQFQPGFAVISCGDHTTGSGKSFEFPARETIERLIDNKVVPIFSTAYPQAEPDEIELIKGKVIVTGYAALAGEDAQYNQSGNMVCSVDASVAEQRYIVQMEAYVGEDEICELQTYQLFPESAEETARENEQSSGLLTVSSRKASFVLIPGVLEFEEIFPLEAGKEGFTAELMLGNKAVRARFVHLSKRRCYEGRVTVLNDQVLSLGDVVCWAKGLFPNLEAFSKQDILAFDQLGIEGIYLYWNAWKKCLIEMKWYGKVTVGAFDFYISFTMPEYRIELRLQPNQRLTLESCLEKAGLPAGALGFFGRIGLDDLVLQVPIQDKCCYMKLQLSTEKTQKGGVSFEKLAFGIWFSKKSRGRAGLEGILCIKEMRVRFTAFYADGGWTLSGEMEDQEGISLGEVLSSVAKEAKAAEAPALPADFQLIYAAVESLTKERNWALRCGGRLTVLGTKLDMGLAVQVKTTEKERELSVVGTVTLLGVDFTCVFEKVQNQSAQLFYIQKKDGLTLDLQELVRLFDENVTLPVDVKLLMREVAVLHLPSGGMVFQAVLGGELSLSLQELPVIGGFLPERADFKVDSIKIGYVRMGGEGEQAAQALAEAGDILSANGLSELPEQLAGGFFMEITADVGGDKIAYLLGEKAQEKPTVMSKRMLPAEIGEAGVSLQGAETEKTSVEKVFPIHKKLGPLELHRITIMMANGKLWLTPDVSVSMGCFLVDFTDVTMGISLADHTVSARVDGMGLSYQQPGLALAAAFRRANDEAMLYRYDGILSVQASKWQLMGMGSYGKLKDGTVSFYLFLDASMRIMLQPSLMLTGIMAGAGINKSLRVPEIAEVEKFPLLAGGRSAATVLDDLNRNWLVSQAGRDWLAVGVRFRVAELVDGKALLMANLGGELEFTLLGLCELELPKNCAKPYLHIALQLRADLKPASGVFGVEIAVGKSSYLLCPDCHITGGAALYTWFAPSVHQGDFVLTIGGYHPAFAVPAHYPKVNRVGIAWQVSREVSLKGEAYFALTPSCAMAGANLSVTYENGDLKAWFTAWANLLIAWKPFHFLADIGVNLGVSYWLNLLFCHKTLTVSIGGSLRLWGPPTGGSVEIHLWFISFTVRFGADENGGNSHRVLSWNEFRELLPQGDTLQIHPTAGLENQSDNGIWLVRGKEFRFTVESSVPASSITVGQNVHRAQGSPIHIRPMNLTEADTEMEVRITHKETKSAAEQDFDMTAKRQRVAESLWGKPLYRNGQFVQSDSVPTANLLDDRLTGAEFITREGKEGTEIVIYDLDALSVLCKVGKEAKVRLRLVDYRLPVLKAGLYEITVTQGIRKAGQIQETFPSKKQSFYVGGCRFAWNKGMVVNTYPPRGSAGSFTNALPYVVLADSTLPWERQYGAAEKTPWLALFLLRRDEIESGENGDGTHSMSIDEFCGHAVGAARPVLQKEPGADGASLCNVLTLPAAMYRALLPSERELCLLCHGRNTGYSVVMANRMPGVGEYTAYLVSLEGTEKLRTVTEGNVQLLCMDSFTFRSTEAAAEDFYHFAVTLLQNNRENVNLGSGMESGIEDGYCSVAYRAGKGAEEWRRFRGMLKPVKAEDTGEELPLKTAFSMGRMLALGQSEFITGMLQYRERRSQMVSRMMRLRSAGDGRRPEYFALQENRDVLQAVRGVDDSIMNLLRPVPKDQLQGRSAAVRSTAAENGSTCQKAEAVYGVRRYTEEEASELRRRRRQAEEVCLCLEKGRSLSASVSETGGQDQVLDRWLEDLLLLKGLLFSCLLPSEKLLPPESVRFFQVDKAWLSAMAAGAAGIGENCRKQAAITRDLLQMWEQRIEQEERYGILLRTHMLRLWQNMAVYACDKAGEEIIPLRQERLAEDILLILCNVPPASLKIREPSEGIRMQLNEDGTIHPRNPKTLAAGSTTLACGNGWKWFRDDSRRILNVAGERGLADMLAEHFGKADLPNGQLTPAGFALQFIEGTRSVIVRL